MLAEFFADVVFEISVIFCVYLEIALRVIAYGANVGSFSANYDVTAVAAFPDLDLTFGEDLSRFHILQ